ncbi:hypothetical protein HK096_000207, partial [Nowakowskiella sp. JEL0078]
MVVMENLRSLFNDDSYEIRFAVTEIVSFHSIVNNPSSPYLLLMENIINLKEHSSEIGLTSNSQDIPVNISSQSALRTLARLIRGADSMTLDDEKTIVAAKKSAKSCRAVSNEIYKLTLSSNNKDFPKKQHFAASNSIDTGFRKNLPNQQIEHEGNMIQTPSLQPENSLIKAFPNKKKLSGIAIQFSTSEDPDLDPRFKKSSSNRSALTAVDQIPNITSCESNSQRESSSSQKIQIESNIGNMNENFYPFMNSKIPDKSKLRSKEHITNETSNSKLLISEFNGKSRETMINQNQSHYVDKEDLESVNLLKKNVIQQSEKEKENNAPQILMSSSEVKLFFDILESENKIIDSFIATAERDFEAEYNLNENVFNPVITGFESFLQDEFTVNEGFLILSPVKPNMEDNSHFGISEYRSENIVKIENSNDGNIANRAMDFSIPEILQRSLNPIIPFVELGTSTQTAKKTLDDGYKDGEMRLEEILSAPDENIPQLPLVNECSISFRRNDSDESFRTTDSHDLKFSESLSKGKKKISLISMKNSDVSSETQQKIPSVQEILTLAEIVHISKFENSFKTDLRIQKPEICNQKECQATDNFMLIDSSKPCGISDNEKMRLTNDFSNSITRNAEIYFGSDICNPDDSILSLEDEFIKSKNQSSNNHKYSVDQETQTIGISIDSENRLIQDQTDHEKSTGNNLAYFQADDSNTQGNPEKNASVAFALTNAASFGILTKQSPTSYSRESLNNNSKTQFIGPIFDRKLRMAIETLIQHLIFGNNLQTNIDYELLYGGKHSDLSKSLFAVPSSQVSVNCPHSIVRKSPDKQQSSHNGSTFIHTSAREELHPTLKQVFELEPQLLIDFCSHLVIGDLNTKKTSTFLSNYTSTIVKPSFSAFGSKASISNIIFSSSTAGLVRPTMANLKEEIKLRQQNWILGLSQVHQHLMPISNIFHDLEKQLRYPLSTAQALVIVKDQVEISKRIGQIRPPNSETGNGEDKENRKNY